MTRPRKPEGKVTRAIKPVGPSSPEGGGRTQAEFIARGLAARDEARRTGVYYDADIVMAELRNMLAEAKARAKAKPRI
jgi:hypothetical protein